MGKQATKRKAPPRYDEAFKAGAMRMVTEQQRPTREVAAELGICVDTLRGWLKAAGVHPGSTDRANQEQRRVRELEAENRALRKQIAEKDEVIDVLIPKGHKQNPWAYFRNHRGEVPVYRIRSCGLLHR